MISFIIPLPKNNACYLNWFYGHVCGRGEGKMTDDFVGIQECSDWRRSEMLKGPTEGKPFSKTEFYRKC
jgi:hypothetical protein